MPNGTPATGTPPNGTPAAGSNGSGSNGPGGAHAATPSSYTRPRTSAAPTRPEPTEQERRVADARIAAAARNASAAKVRGGSALSGRTPVADPKTGTGAADASAPVDETAVIPVVPAEDAAVAAPSEPLYASPADADAGASGTTTTEKRRGMFGRLRDRRSAHEPAATTATPEVAPVVVPDAAAAAKTDERAVAKTDGETAQTDEPVARAEPAPEKTEQDAATTERPLTWRDRLGLPPREPKPERADAPEASTSDESPATTAAAGAAAGAAGVAAASATTQDAPVQGRVAPSPFAPGGATDTVELPAVEAAATGAPVPAAGTTALPVVAAAAPKPKVGAARRTRKARLRLSRVDPWSVMKTALLFSIAAGIILVVATYGVWSVLNASGLFDAVNDMVKSVVSTPGDTTPFRIEEYVNTQKIIGVAALIAVVDVLIFTALATLGSFLYNLAATVLGGLEVTLAED